MNDKLSWKFLLSGLLRGDGQPAYSSSSSDNAECRVEIERERGREGGGGVRVVLFILGGVWVLCSFPGSVQSLPGAAAKSAHCRSDELFSAPGPVGNVADNELFTVAHAGKS